MRIISIANQKGGCGKTTTALNLAASLSGNGRQVLLIDLDPQAHASSGLNIKSSLSMYNVLSKMTHKKARLEEIIQSVDTGFDIAPSSMILSTLEQELSSEIGRESRLFDTLNNFKSNYDYVLIDCPPNLGILTINAIRACSEMIIPVEASRFAFEGVGQLVDIISLIKDRLNHSVDYRILVTNFDSRLRHSFTMLDKIKTNFKGKLFGNIIHVNVKLKEAQNNGTHIFSYDKYCRGAKDYFSLAREVIMQEKGAHKTPAETPRKSSVPLAALEKKMEEILKQELPKMQEASFSISAPQAKDVFVSGDFNDWKIDENSRMEFKNGSWSKRLKLNPGSYHYRFVIDGKWTEDPNNANKQVNPYGEMDSILEVKLTK